MVDGVQVSNVIVKLSDYGISSQNQFFIGGDYYLAPETNLTAGSDIWQLGTLLFYLFSEKQLDFKIDSNLTLISTLKEKGLKNDDFLVDLISSCLKPLPNQRITGNGLIRKMKDNQQISFAIQKYLDSSESIKTSEIRVPTSVVPNYMNLSSWLISIGLENYIQDFENYGIKDLSICQSMKEEEVSKIIPKYGHVKKFLWKASKINF
jgi:serine/threonine protein kinase